MAEARGAEVDAQRLVQAQLLARARVGAQALDQQLQRCCAGGGTEVQPLGEMGSLGEGGGEIGRPLNNRKAVDKRLLPAPASHPAVSITVTTPAPLSVAAA